MQKNFNPVSEYTVSEEDAAKLRVPERQNLTAIEIKKLSEMGWPTRDKNQTERTKSFSG
jgi:hypothetical protein